MRDEGRPFGFGDQVADPKPPQAAVVKSHGSERCGKARTMILAGKVERDAMGPAAWRLHPPSAVVDPLAEQLMSKQNDLSRSLVPLNSDSTLIVTLAEIVGFLKSHSKGD
jgi:hypothetical protein